jgi:hypothetical protein
MIKSQAIKISSRTPYKAPKVTTYGAMSKLTASGSGDMTEDNQNAQAQPQKRP